jgi:hypothetical protein
MFTESLPRNERLLWLRYSDFRALRHIIYGEVENWEEMSRAYSFEGTEENSGSPSKYNRCHWNDWPTSRTQVSCIVAWETSSIPIW